jgi:hypothetical protein
MKKLITILIVFISLNISAQKDTLKVNETMTERIIDKYSDKIINSFNTTIDNVTPIAEKGFTMVVKLKFVQGIAMILPLIFAIIFFILFTKEYNKIQLKCEILNEKGNEYIYKKSPFDDGMITPPLIIYLIILIILTIIALLTTYSGITHIIVPEWFAIKEIINLI